MIISLISRQLDHEFLDLISCITSAMISILLSLNHPSLFEPLAFPSAFSPFGLTLDAAMEHSLD